MLKRVALYARVSTQNHGQDPEVQLRDMRRDCQQREWRIVDTYVDTGISGTKSHRPELDRLMADAAAHRFDVVMVWRFDRFARSTIHLAQALEFFKGLGIAFVSMTEQVDTSTPAGKLVFTILGACAEMEREIIVERVRAGLRNAVAKGKKLGRPACQVMAETVRQAVDAHDGSVAKAAKALGISYGKAYELNHRVRAIRTERGQK